MSAERINKEMLNKMLEMREQGIAIKKIEKNLSCFILHKILPVMERYYKGKLPKKVGDTEVQIILGKLREEELFYRKKVEEAKRGQKSMKEFWK